MVAARKFKTGFVAVTDREIRALFERAQKAAAEMTFWLKNRPERFSARLVRYERADRKIMINFTAQDPNVTPNLARLELNGQSYFLTVSDWDEQGAFFSATISGDVFKYERRRHFRLYSLYRHDIVAQFDLEFGKKSASSVIDIRTGMSHQDIFKKFLALIGDNQNSNTFNVVDLSVSGMSLQMSGLFRHHFAKDRVYHNIKLVVQGDLISIPAARVVYQREVVSNGGWSWVQVGFEFEELFESHEYSISNRIQRLLRVASDDEDFESMLD